MDLLLSARESPAAATPSQRTVPLGDWIATGLVFAVMIVLKTLYVHSLPWHSDEPQHLHVVWGWASGRLPYRDVFDNHSPLFGCAFSPLFRLVGERNDVVDAMRWFMLPLFGVSLFCLYRMGEIALSRRAGLWAAAIGGFFPPWFLKMGEFRTDVLWTTLWLVTLAVLVSGRLSTRRLFFAGLVLGAAFSVSMKTTLMLLAICAAAGVMAACLAFSRGARSSGDSAAGRFRMLGAALLGIFAVPVAFVGFFAVKGVLPQMYYCVILHNLNGGGHSAGRILHHFRSWYSLLVPLTLVLGWAISVLGGDDRAQTARRIFLLGVAGLFCPILQGVWTSVTPQDYLPLWPLAGCLAAVAILVTVRQARLPLRTVRLLETAVPIAFAVAEFLLVVRTQSPSAAPNLAGIQTIKEARELTRPDECLMDAKGESIYRPRPYWYVLETLTRKQLYAALDPDPGKTPGLADTLPQNLVETRTAVVLPSKRMMEDSLKFIDQNYLGVGMLRVLGQIVWPSDSGVYVFEVAIPERYVIVGKLGEPALGELDGVPLAGPRTLDAGHHEFQRWSGAGPVTVIWARAAEQGFRADAARRR